MKRSTIYIGMSLALSLGLLLVLLWLLGGEIGISVFTARAAEPAGLTTAPGDVYCVTLAGGGPYSGCDEVFTSVQDAVDAASGGEVVKVAAGNYTGVQGRPAPAGYNGPSVITQVVYISKAVSIQGGYTITNWATSYPITQPTTLDAQGQGRALLIAGDINPTIEGLYLTGGDAAGLGGKSGDCGGGVYIIRATAAIRDNQVFNNSGNGYGGGLCLQQSDAMLVGNAVFSNASYSAGGGLYLDGSGAALIGNTITSNIVTYYGGGLYLDGSDATLTGNLVSANSGSLGGGLYLYTGSPTLIGNTVSANSGGGLALDHDNATLTNNTISANFYDSYGSSGGGLSLHSSGAVLNRNTVIFNSASSGGGLYLYESDATLDGNTIVSNTSSTGGGLAMLYGANMLVNTVVAGNQADTAGGGLYVRGASPHLVHTTVARNTGGDGSGVYVTDAWGQYSTVMLTNTILVSHTVGVYVPSGNTAKLEGTLWGSGAWANETDWGGAGTIVTGTVNIWDNPDFVDPDSGDYHIDLGSAARDEGVDAGVHTDIDGEVRPFGPKPDMGADELAVTLSIGKVGPVEVLPGEPITYALTITNSGVLSATGTVITDALPAGARYVSGGTLMPGDVISWTVGDLLPGYGMEALFVVTATQTITNSDYRVSCAEGVSAAGKAPIVTNVLYPDLAIGKTGPFKVMPDSFITYTLTITNGGVLSATGVVITDALPTGAHYVSGGTLMPSGVISWTVGDLLPNNSTQMQLIVTATQTITNSDYRVSCIEGVSTAGTETVVTDVGYFIYLPLALQSFVPPIPIAIAGEWSDDLYSLLSGDPDLSNYTFTTVGSDWTYSTIQSYDGVIVNECDACLSASKTTALRQFYDSGKPVILGMEDVDEQEPVQQADVYYTFGVTNAEDGHFDVGTLNMAHSIAQGVTLSDLGTYDHDHFDANGAVWVVQGSDGNYYVLAYDGPTRSVIFGENLHDWWEAGNEQLIRNAIDWVMAGSGF